MSRQIFSDPQRRRWKRLRRIIDVTAIASTIVLVAFFLNVLRREKLPELLFPQQKRNYKALAERQHNLQKAKGQRPARRKTNRKPSDIPLNTGEGLRAAYYVDDDPASYASLKAHIHQIDILFPVWLHAFDPTGNLMAATPLFPVSNYRVVDDHGVVHGVDPQNKVRNVIADAKEDTAIVPLISNFDAQKGDWQPVIGQMLMDPQARLNLRTQMDKFFATNPTYRGLSLDFEEIPDEAADSYLTFINELYTDFHARNLRLYVNTPTSASDNELTFLGGHTDGILLMNYDEHENTSEPGPIASEDWFENNLQRTLKLVPKEKVICAIGNYAYDWSVPLPAKGKPVRGAPKVLDVSSLHVQEAWQEASDAGADVHLEGDELNAHFAFDDEDAQVRHQVWMLDAVTALNEMRAARAMGIQTFSLWVLGEEDPSLWANWDHPNAANAPQLIKTVPPGQSVDTDGDGDILRITETPSAGSRTVNMDELNQTVTDEHMVMYPKAFAIQYFGYQPNRVALTFDDGPDPKWTPRILKILKDKHVTGTFFVIGEEAEDRVALLREYVNQGHIIGNHTLTHPDISEISSRQLELEINWTERLFASKLGLRPLFFRPPYSVDQEPDTNDQAAPAFHIQQMGYTIIGDKIDTDDWDEHPRKTPEEITRRVFAQLADMKSKHQPPGSIILMHDGGGDRSATVAALPVLIDALRAHGYTIVSVPELMGKTNADVMPPIAAGDRLQAHIDSVAFFFIAFFSHFVVYIFYIGDVLMSARLLTIGVLALIDRLRKRKVPHIPDFLPRVAVLVPAYNEETVIVRTIRSVLNSDYANLHVIVIDDGSKDRTAEVAAQAYAAEIRSGKVQILRKPNAGKAEALNYAVERIDEEIYVGIDADTVIASDAVSKLICHFTDPDVGAVAGNARVGNKVNLWTRWQALEYITSQNFERRAQDLFNIVTVVPGAIGAWRTEAVRHGGGYPINTVAEDADLTMNLIEQGYKVIYEDQSLAFTEAPINAGGLMRQRFRWSFGTLQAIFKHRGAFTKNSAMGYFALPNILVFQILLPLVSPFIDLFFVAGVVQYMLDRHFHPEAASAASFDKLLLYFLSFLVIDFVTSSLAFSLERAHPAKKGDNWLLFHIWLQRFAYRQVFSVVLFKTVKRAIDGRPFNWDKLERTAKMSVETEKIASGM